LRTRSDTEVLVHGYAEWGAFELLDRIDGMFAFAIWDARERRAMLARDVENMTAYYGLFAPRLLATRYAQEIWEHYEEGDLHPDIGLTGYAEEDTHTADVDSVMLEIKDALKEEQERQERMRDAEELD